jgi:isocitrate dehydrogenase
MLDSQAPVSSPATIAVAYGDGIGPEIMESVLRILKEAGAQLNLIPVQAGYEVYRRGLTSGIDPDAWEPLRRAGVLLKAPLTTPQGGGFKSVNVTLRKTLGMYANVRPTVAYAPFVPTRHPKMDVVIIRENEEDLYAGIEHRQTDEVYQCLKLITRPGCEKIVRFAFEYARKNGRKKVTCFSKDNIMKLTDGLFHKVFDEIAAEYPEITNEHMIVDIGAARLANQPERFDVIVTSNLYGDILSDVAAEIAGSVGLAGSANIGDKIAMFEAIHGSAPDIAGQDLANPSGLLLSAVMMLVHLGQNETAARVHNALLRTLEDGIHTADVYHPDNSKEKAGTRQFTQAVIDRLGMRPQVLTPVDYAPAAPATGPSKPTYNPTVRAKKETVGVDVFLHWSDGTPDDLAARLQPTATAALTLNMITNRGVKVWPAGAPETFCTDHWRCRFIAPQGQTISHLQILEVLARIHQAGLDFVKMENLCTFNGDPGFSLGQGQ